MFTTPMIQLFAVVLERDTDAVTEALLREGVMQFINISEYESGEQELLSAMNPKVSLAQLSDLCKRIEGFLLPIGCELTAPLEKDLINRIPVSLEKEKKYLDKLVNERESLRSRQRTIQQEILKLEDIKRQVDLYDLGISDVALHSKHTFITLQIGMIPTVQEKALESGLKDFPSVHLLLNREQDMNHTLIIFMKRDADQIKHVLDSLGWTPVEIPSELKTVKKDISIEFSGKLEKFIAEQKKLEEKGNDLIRKEKEILEKKWLNIRVNELFYKIQTHFKSSSRTVLFSGWLPQSQKERISSIINSACENRCYMEWMNLNKVQACDIPVQFNNSKLLAPFQMLVSNFGIPQYGTIDPTPFVMISYLTMFGLMFADAGQGALLMILGGLGITFLGKNPEKNSIKTLLSLLIWCGGASVVFGVLFGSYFGMGLFKPIWFDFHGIILGHSSQNGTIKDVYDILAITIFFGISVILVGLLFNWINLIHNKKWFDLLFDKGGLVGGWLYGCGIYTASYMVKSGYKSMPSTSILLLLFCVPAVFLFFKEPLHYMKHANNHNDEKFTIFVLINFMMEWIVTLLEIFSGYLSNTLSFMRVAGLGIAHVCLMISFFTLADMTNGIMSIFILILGNMLVIGLEGLSAGIQALRLNYYEFFTKFFHGTGKLYSPISLNNRS